MLNLVVGDVHATTDDLADCEALLQLVDDAAEAEDVETITFLGDIFHNHVTLSVKTLEFWHRWFNRLKQCNKTVIALRGNHDQSSPSRGFPHALLAYPDIIAVDSPRVITVGDCRFGAMPYYYDPQEFIKDATELKAKNPDLKTLFCHQTVTGAKYENGFFAKDAVDPEAVPFDVMIVGHIHVPSKIGKAVYIGAPRWKTLSDAGYDRHIWVMKHFQDGNIRPIKRIPTDTVCQRIYSFVDRPELLCDLTAIPPEKRSRATIRVSVYGPTPEYVREREQVLKGLGCITRGFPERLKKREISEIEGIPTAFSRYLTGFVPPNGTDKTTLISEVEKRLG